jgi:hypothetical protein
MWNQNQPSNFDHDKIEDEKKTIMENNQPMTN